MRKLKSTSLYSGASRPAFVPGLQLPLGVSVMLVFAGGYSVILFSDFRWWLTMIIFWVIVWLFLRVMLKRDHNALRVLGRGWLPKTFSFDDHVWGGITVFNYPVRDRRPTPRGIP
jgi:type IV secretory pathway VirB3-like protein